ncbi:MAG: PAS domain-containing protein [Hyphomicrobiaceae bacterium]
MFLLARHAPDPASGGLDRSRVKMQHRTSQILFSYWNEVRRGRLAPRRFDIEPARLGAVLAETMILEHAQPHTYRFRLAGTRLVEQFGAELRGTNFLDLWFGEERVAVALMLNQLTSGGAGIITFDGLTSDGRGARFESVLLPLMHTRDVIDRFLGAVSCAQAPGWIGTAPIVTLRLVQHDIVGSDRGARSVRVPAADVRPALDPDLSEARIVRSDRRQFRVLDGGLCQIERSTDKSG